MKKIAVIGSDGFVGSQISKQIESSERFVLVPVTRGDNLKDAIEFADIIIHSANPAKRFFAENNPEKDFHETVEKTGIIKSLSRNKPLILISSISARTQLDSVYGRNRRSCELIADLDRSLVVRLGPMFGPGKSIGVLNDIINNRKVYAAASTEYAFVDVTYNAKKIVSLISKYDTMQLVEIGARNGITLESLRDKIKSTSTFEGRDDTQLPVSPPDDAPDVSKVIVFAKTMKTYGK